MFFSRSSTTTSDDESTSSFCRLSLSHDDTPTSSPRSDFISSSATSFSIEPEFLIASSDEPTSSFCRLSFSHDDTPLCWSCDAAVHDTNSLVARNITRLACASCRTADSSRRFSGPSSPHPPPIPTLCPSYRPADLPAPSPLPPPTTLTPTMTSSASASASSRVPAVSIFRRFLLLWCNDVKKKKEEEEDEKKEK